MLSYCVYILFSDKDFNLYTGYTSDIKRRLQEHNNGKNKSTKDRIPLRLIFCEYYLFEEDARKREIYLKTSMGKKAIRIMLSGTLTKIRTGGGK